jgi:hypothetical protein
MRKVVLSFQIVLLCLSAIACGDSPPSNANTGERTCAPISDTPTEAYKRLYAAVKEKNTEKIKGEMSKQSQGFMEAMAGKQNKPVEQVYANGFTATTFSPTLPEIRDERVKGCWGAVEVRNDKDKRWEDLPYVIEDGSWKLAVGEIFSDQYRSPGKGMDLREKEASNTSRGNVPMAPNPIANVSDSNANANSSPAPKYDGPQVEPLPKKK